MYLFQISQDSDRKIDLNSVTTTADSSESSDDETFDEEPSLLDESDEDSEPAYVAPTPPARAAVSPSPERQAKIQAMLASRKK
jgi:hypothetical protein